VEELQMANEYQLRLKDMSYSEKMKELTDKFIQEKDELKRQLQLLRSEKDKEEARHDEEVCVCVCMLGRVCAMCVCARAVCVCVPVC